jgi:hypothetical protein
MTQQSELLPFRFAWRAFLAVIVLPFIVAVYGMVTNPVIASALLALLALFVIIFEQSLLSAVSSSVWLTKIEAG